MNCDYINTNTGWLLLTLLLMIFVIKLFKVNWITHEPRLIDKIICWLEYRKWGNKQAKKKQNV